MIPSPLPAPSLPSSSQPGTARKDSYLREEGQRNLVGEAIDLVKHGSVQALWGSLLSVKSHKSPKSDERDNNDPNNSDKSMQANCEVAARELLWFLKKGKLN